MTGPLNSAAPSWALPAAGVMNRPMQAPITAPKASWLKASRRSRGVSRLERILPQMPREVLPRLAPGAIVVARDHQAEGDRQAVGRLGGVVEVILGEQQSGRLCRGRLLAALFGRGPLDLADRADPGMGGSEARAGPGLTARRGADGPADAHHRRQAGAIERGREILVGATRQEVEQQINLCQLALEDEGLHVLLRLVVFCHGVPPGSQQSTVARDRRGQSVNKGGVSIAPTAFAGRETISALRRSGSRR